MGYSAGVGAQKSQGWAAREPGGGQLPPAAPPPKRRSCIGDPKHSFNWEVYPVLVESPVEEEKHSSENLQLVNQMLSHSWRDDDVIISHFPN